MKIKLILGATAFALALTGLAFAAPQAAQTEKKAPTREDIDKLVEVMRKDVRAEKADIVSKTMAFDASQAAAFWPIYKQYEAERQALGDEMLGIIQDYAEHYESMNDTKAQGLVARTIAVEEKRVALVKKYAAEFEKVLPAKVVGRFLQVDRRINMLIDLKVSSQIPLVE
jgi:hypothetical protein